MRASGLINELLSLINGLWKASAVNIIRDLWKYREIE